MAVKKVSRDIYLGKPRAMVLANALRGLGHQVFSTDCQGWGLRVMDELSKHGVPRDVVNRLIRELFINA